MTGALPGDPTQRRLLGPLVAFAVTLGLVRAGGVGPGEVAVFRLVNGRPDWLLPPAWVVMQFGAFGAVPASATLALLAGRRRTALRLAAAGGSAYFLAKLVKRGVRRARPAELLAEVRVRGKPADGNGYLSGHAAVAAALAGAARSALPKPAGRTAVAAAPVVGLTRIFVGAHLPWDVAGGLALGSFVGAAVNAMPQP